jgi:carbon storage regulator
MLVLSRKLNEKIIIDGEITITVVKIDRNQVRIGIEAPGHVPVYREELLPHVRKEKTVANVPSELELTGANY